MSRAVVIYDGNCRFCRASVSTLRRLDWRARLEFASARDSEVLQAHPQVVESRALERLQLVTPDRHVLEGFHAFRWLTGRLPLLWLSWPFLWLPGMTRVGTWAYDLVARNRFLFGTCAEGACELPGASGAPASSDVSRRS